MTEPKEDKLTEEGEINYEMKRHNEILVKHLETEIHVALSGAQYKPLGKDMTDEDFDIARKTTEVLIDRTSIDKGLTLEALATMILGDSSAQSVHKIERAIQWTTGFRFSCRISYDRSSWSKRTDCKCN